MPREWRSDDNLEEGFVSPFMVIWMAMLFLSMILTMIFSCADGVPRNKASHAENYGSSCAAGCSAGCGAWIVTIEFLPVWWHQGVSESSYCKYRLLSNIHNKLLSIAPKLISYWSNPVDIFITFSNGRIYLLNFNKTSLHFQFYLQFPKHFYKFSARSYCNTTSYLWCGHHTAWYTKTK